MLALRQNGRTLEELKVDDREIGSTILATFSQLSDEIASMKQSSDKESAQHQFESCFSDFVSLLSEYYRPEKKIVTSFPLGFGVNYPANWTV